MTTGTLALVFAACWAVCELLAAIPSVKSNSVFQLIYNTIKSLAGK
jgi:hypothetical protein